MEAANTSVTSVNIEIPEAVTLTPAAVKNKFRMPHIVRSS
jgi:hypothetical protein